ncbi:MAG: hypothetical protein NC342_00005 [Pseudoflavonifractor sp.]|nr:hypothetical protein [Alloprevotella sp.]MCM1115910.1 hypothetical protein [Pseudoflavonifractor sp.]
MDNALCSFREGASEVAFSEALTAFDFSKELGDTVNMIASQSLMADIYASRSDFDNAFRCGREALMYAKAMGCDSLRSSCCLSIARNMLLGCRYRQALDYVDSSRIVGAGEADVSSLAVECIANIALGYYNVGDSLLTVVKASPFEEIDQFVEMCRRASGSGEISDRVQSLETYRKRHLAATSLARIASNHRQRLSEVELHETQMRESRTMLLLLLCAMALIIVVVSSLYISSRLKRDKLQAQNQLLLLAKEYQLMKQDVDNRSDSLRRQLCDAFLSQYGWVERLANLYMDSSLVPSGKESLLYKKVEAEIAGVDGSSFAGEILSVIQGSDEALYQEISGYGLADSERDMLLFLLAGFSPRVISFLTGKTLRAVYNLKSRIKGKLKGVNVSEPISNLFI